MILQLFLGLVSIALLFFLIGQEKRRRIWSVLLFGAVLALLYAFFEKINAIGISNVMYSWIPHHTLQANLSFVTAGKASACVSMMSLCLAAMIYLNIVYRREEYSLYINNFILLNFAALIILLASQDFIQLMIGSCCFSIIGFYLINDVEAKTRFIFYNFLAELAVFTALAVVYAHLGTITLSALLQYLQAGRHKDLVSTLLLGAVFAKCGMFLFQSQIIGLKRLAFNRGIAVAVFGAPLSGLIVFAKLMPLIEVSAYAQPLFNVIVGISAVWAAAGVLLIDSLKAKILYLNMFFYSFCLYMMWGGGDVFYNRLVYLYPPLLGIYTALLFASVSASDEVQVSQMGGFARRLWLDFLLGLLAVFVLIGIFFKHFDSDPAKWFVYIFLGLVAAVLHMVYLGKNHSDERVEALLKNINVACWLPFLIVNGWWLSYSGLYKSDAVWAYFGFFAAAVILLPAGFAFRFAGCEGLQKGDIMHRFYIVLLITPLRLLGRVLWLAIDFVVIERSVIGSISHSTRFVVQNLQKIQGAGWANYFMMILLGLAVVLLNLGWYCYG